MFTALTVFLLVVAAAHAAVFPDQRASGVSQVKCSQVTSSSSQYVHIKDVEGRDLLCDAKTDGGKWTVIQHRTDGSENFYRPWVDYEHGFGNTSGEFWFGLSNIHHIMRQDRYEMRIDFTTSTGSTLYAQYDDVTLSSAIDNYRINLGGYHGNAGDYFLYGAGYYNLNGMEFSTYDKDNDKSALNCVRDLYHGAWWHNACTAGNPNGEWRGASPAWASWGFSNSFTDLAIKIRPYTGP